MRLLFCLLFSIPLSLSACDCFYTEYFCEYTKAALEWSPDNTVVMRARLKEYRTPNVDGFFPLYDFEVLDVLVGEFDAPIVSLLGQDGANCNGPNTQPTEGQEYVMMFSRREGYFSAYGIDDFSNPYPIHDYPGCGDGTLEVSNNRVLGKITEGLSSISLNSLRDHLSECLGEEFIKPPGAGILPYYEASVLPNPASESFTVTFAEPTPVFAVRLYDMRGRVISGTKNDGQELTEHLVNVSQLPAGIYQLMVLTDGIRVRKQVVVL